MTDFIPFPTPPGDTSSGTTPKPLPGDEFSVGQKIFVRTTATYAPASNSPVTLDSPEAAIIGAVIPPAGSWSFDPASTSATLTVGDELEIDWNAAGSPGADSLVYLWELSQDGSTSWAAIPGETGTTYTLASADQTEFIRVTGTATSSTGGVVQTTQTWTNPIQAAVGLTTQLVWEAPISATFTGNTASLGSVGTYTGPFAPNVSPQGGSALRTSSTSGYIELLVNMTQTAPWDTASACDAYLDALSASEVLFEIVDGSGSTTDSLLWAQDNNLTGVGSPIAQWENNFSDPTFMRLRPSTNSISNGAPNQAFYTPWWTALQSAGSGNTVRLTFKW
jgi:hypothetical protein